jgi:hypothetical protein
MWEKLVGYNLVRIFSANQKIKVMLKNHLPAIKGRLLLHFTEQYSIMCTDSEGEINHQEFFEDIQECLKDICDIKTIDNLDRFCEVWGLNDLQSDLSFSELAKEYLKF